MIKAFFWNILYTGGEIAHRSGWFRLLGFGLRWINHDDQEPVFSERYGYGIYLHAGRWCFKFFAPDLLMRKMFPSEK